MVIDCIFIILFIINHFIALIYMIFEPINSEVNHDLSEQYYLTLMNYYVGCYLKNAYLTIISFNERDLK